MSKILIIPDVHQNIDWVKTILNREGDGKDFDKVVFLSDFFDSFKEPPHVAGARETAEFALFLDKVFGEKAVFLFSNHDIGYYYGLRYSRQFKSSPDNPFYCSGFTQSKAIETGKIITDAFVEKQKLAAFIDGVSYTHAGVTPDFIPFSYNVDTGEQKLEIEKFLEEADYIAKNFRSHSGHPFFRCGDARDGSDGVTGGLIWLDWEMEHYTNEFMPPQLFGHSHVDSPEKKASAWNIDTGQKFYAIVEDGKKITLKHAYTDEVIEGDFNYV